MSSANRDIDQRVARVLGYADPVELRRRGDKEFRTYFKVGGFGSGLGTYDCLYERDGTKVFCAKPYTPHDFPAFSSDPAALERVKAWLRGREVAFCVWHFMDGVKADLWTVPVARASGKGAAPSEGEALCKAVVEAFGSKEGA